MPVENKPKDLIAYFSTPEKPCTTSEYMAFWKSLTDDQKAYYREFDLTTVK